MPRGRLGRAQLFAFATLAVAGCGGEDPGNVAGAYGGPPTDTGGETSPAEGAEGADTIEPVEGGDAGATTDPPPDNGSIQPMYGATPAD